MQNKIWNRAKTANEIGGLKIENDKNLCNPLDFLLARGEYSLKSDHPYLLWVYGAVIISFHGAGKTDVEMKSWVITTVGHLHWDGRHDFHLIESLHWTC